MPALHDARAGRPFPEGTLMTSDDTVYTSLAAVSEDCSSSATPCTVCGSLACAVHDPWVGAEHESDLAPPPAPRDVTAFREWVLGASSAQPVRDALAPAVRRLAGSR